MSELYNLAPLFPGNNDADQLNRIIKVLGTPDANEWPEGYKLAKKLGKT
jgi:protein kinase